MGNHMIGEKIITGRDMPADLRAALERLGIPLRYCTAFKIEITDPGLAMIVSYTAFAVDAGGALTGAVETRKFKIVEVE